MKQRTLLRTGVTLLGAGLLAVSLSGCVVVPLPHARARGGVVVVEPGYGNGPPHYYRDRYDRRDDRRYDRRDGRY